MPHHVPSASSLVGRVERRTRKQNYHPATGLRCWFCFSSEPHEDVLVFDGSTSTAGAVSSSSTVRGKSCMGIYRRDAGNVRPQERFETAEVLLGRFETFSILFSINKVRNSVAHGIFLSLTLNLRYFLSILNLMISFVLANSFPTSNKC